MQMRKLVGKMLGWLVRAPYVSRSGTWLNSLLFRPMNRLFPLAGFGLACSLRVSAARVGRDKPLRHPRYGPRPMIGCS